VSERPLSFRIAADEDYPRLGALSVLAYPWSNENAAARTDRYRWSRDHLAAERWIVERDGKHVGQWANLQFTGWFGGVAAPVGGLAGVAVAPEARKSGVARAIMLQHLAWLREREQAWGHLHPFSEAFYASFGWAAAAQLQRWRFTPREIPGFSERALVERLDLADAATAAAVERCYARFCECTNGSLSRRPGFIAARWRGEKEIVVGVRNGGEITGYLHAHWRAPTPQPQTLVVPELVVEDDRSFRALAGFLAAQVDQIAHIELDTAIGDPFGALIGLQFPAREELEFPEGHQPVATRWNGAMARIVDLRRALLGRGYPPGSHGRLAIAARDAELPENQRLLTLTVEDSAPSVSEGQAAGVPFLRGPIDAIGQVLNGAVPLWHAIRAARVTLENANPAEIRALDRLLSLPPPFSLVSF
jgi:predicted acetyltransferase